MEIIETSQHPESARGCDTVFWSVGLCIVFGPIRGRVQGGDFQDSLISRRHSH
jgi:hypothetical protein